MSMSVLIMIVGIGLLRRRIVSQIRLKARGDRARMAEMIIMLEKEFRQIRMDHDDRSREDLVVGESYLGSDSAFVQSLVAP
ncbi:hypothetical protein Tco_0459635 [Tanacetum coccineum]